MSNSNSYILSISGDSDNLRICHGYTIPCALVASGQKLYPAALQPQGLRELPVRWSCGRVPESNYGAAGFPGHPSLPEAVQVQQAHVIDRIDAERMRKAACIVPREFYASVSGVRHLCLSGVWY